MVVYRRGTFIDVNVKLELPSRCSKKGGGRNALENSTIFLTSEERCAEKLEIPKSKIGMHDL